MNRLRLESAGSAEKKLAGSEVVERGLGWRMGQLLSSFLPLSLPHSLLESLFTGVKANSS